MDSKFQDLLNVIEEEKKHQQRVARDAYCKLEKTCNQLESDVKDLKDANLKRHAISSNRM
jgi:wobble nucleotide-excising tRNase